MEQQHIVRSFDKELSELEDKIFQMGDVCISMIKDAVGAIVENRSDDASQVIGRDHLLDEAERFIDEKAIAIIAKRQPMAVDLRQIIGTIRISSDLERIGDMSKNIAKRTSSILIERLDENIYETLDAMAQSAVKQLTTVLEAYKARSLDGLESVREGDLEIDAIYTTLYRDLLLKMERDGANISICTHLLFSAKNIERIGDHVTNMAETIHYIITGDYLPAERRKNDKTYKVVL